MEATHRYMNVMGSQFTHLPTVCSTVCSSLLQWKYMHTTDVCEGNPSITVIIHRRFTCQLAMAMKYKLLTHFLRGCWFWNEIIKIDLSHSPVTWLGFFKSVSMFLSSLCFSNWRGGNMEAHKQTLVTSHCPFGNRMAFRPLLELRASIH